MGNLLVLDPPPAETRIPIELGELMPGMASLRKLERPSTPRELTPEEATAPALAPPPPEEAPPPPPAPVELVITSGLPKGEPTFYELPCGTTKAVYPPNQDQDLDPDPQPSVMPIADVAPQAVQPRRAVPPPPPGRVFQADLAADEGPPVPVWKWNATTPDKFEIVTQSPIKFVDHKAKDLALLKKVRAAQQAMRELEEELLGRLL